MKKVIIMGAGSGCDRVLHHLADDIEVVAIADNFKSGEEYRGQKIESPALALQKQHDFILVASQSFDEISQQLIEIGAEENRVLPAAGYVLQNNIPKTSFNTTITGLSYAKGLMDNKLNPPAANLAAPSQDLFMDFCWMSHYLDECIRKGKKPERAIIGLAHYSFDYDLFQSNIFKKSSRSSIGIYARHALVLEEIKKYSSEKYQNVVERCDSFRGEIEQLRSVFHFRNTTEDIRSTVGSNLETRRMELGQIHSNRNFNVTVIENKKILSNYLQLLFDNQIEPYILICPQLADYRNGFSKNKTKEFYTVINGLRKKFNFKLLDYYEDPGFTIYDFADCDHLNVEGYLKLTHKVDAVLNNREV